MKTGKRTLYSPNRDRCHPLPGRAGLTRREALSPGYCLKISRAARMSELVDRTIAGLAALGGSGAFLEILRRWLQGHRTRIGGLSFRGFVS